MIYRKVVVESSKRSSNRDDLFLNEECEATRLIIVDPLRIFFTLDEQYDIIIERYASCHKKFGNFGAETNTSSHSNGKATILSVLNEF
jgi:hypothetical protein